MLGVLWTVEWDLSGVAIVAAVAVVAIFAVAVVNVSWLCYVVVVFAQRWVADAAQHQQQ